jgi:hypothetical protein
MYALNSFKTIIDRLGRNLPFKGLEILLIPTIFIYFKWENWLTLGDCSYYTKSGFEILTRENPYFGEAKWGSFGAVVMYLLFGWYPEVLASVVLLVLNLVGIYKFAKLQTNSPKTATAVSLIVAMSSINRENLVNGQITGFILLAIVISYKLIVSSNHLLFSSTLLLFAMEMKPQVVIPLTLFLFRGKVVPWKKLLIVALVSHSLINILNGNFLDRDFVRQILEKSTSNPNKIWENTNNLLPILDQFLNNPSITKIFGLLIVIIFCLHILFTKSDFPIFSLIVATLFMPYIHLYDMLGLSILIWATFIRRGIFRPGDAIALIVILSPLRNLSPLNLAVAITIICSLMASSKFKFKKDNWPRIIPISMMVPNVIPSLRPESALLINCWITLSVSIALLLLYQESRQAQHA